MENNKTSFVMLDQERLRSTNQELFDTFKCIICFNITPNNLITKCCDQIICDKCLKEWPTKKKECPQCRASKFKMVKLNRKMESVIETLKFNCPYNYQGCHEINLTVSTMLEHENSCLFNPNLIVKCDKCNFECENINFIDHDCIKSLQNEVEKLKSQIKKFSNFANIKIKKANIGVISDILHSLK